MWRQAESQNEARVVVDERAVARNAGELVFRDAAAYRTYTKPVIDSDGDVVFYGVPQAGRSGAVLHVSGSTVTSRGPSEFGSTTSRLADTGVQVGLAARPGRTWPRS